MTRGPFGKSGSCAWWRAGPSVAESTTSGASNSITDFFAKAAKPPKQEPLTEPAPPPGQGPAPGSAVTEKSLETHNVGREDTPTLSEVVKVAAFDLDSTLIVTKSGGSFARGGHDWKWIKPGVPDFLVKQAKTHRIVVLSNQGAVVMGNTKSWTNLETKITGVCRAMPCDADVYAACKDKQSIYRKPGIGMWELYTKHLDAQDEEIDLQNSFFVGDAAGRKGDHSNSDKAFAERVDLRFLTPEEWFEEIEILEPATVPETVEVVDSSETTPAPEEPPLKRQKQN